MAARLNASRYYETYSGHEVVHLQQVHGVLRPRSERMIFFAGDSSLDNKYWFSGSALALNGYEDVLSPPQMKQDVCYWVNSECVRRQEKVCCLNTAVEASSLNSRSCCCLLGQDEFIRDHIQR